MVDLAQLKCIFSISVYPQTDSGHPADCPIDSANAFSDTSKCQGIPAGVGRSVLDQG